MLWIKKDTYNNVAVQLRYLACVWVQCKRKEGLSSSPAVYWIWEEDKCAMSKSKDELDAINWLPEVCNNRKQPASSRMSLCNRTCRRMFAMVNRTSTTSPPKRTPWLHPSWVTSLKLMPARPCGYELSRLSGWFLGRAALNGAMVSAKHPTLLSTGIKVALLQMANAHSILTGCLMTHTVKDKSF
jgi:hypothetical protein